MGLVIDLVVFVALLGFKAWAAFGLMNGYRPSRFLATPRARGMYATNLATTALLGLPVVVASYASGMWWVEAAAWTFATLCAWKVGWVVHMRRSGKHIEYYRRHQMSLD